MKKIILAIALFATVSVNAQNDSFFKYNNVEEQRREDDGWRTMPTLIGHGYTSDIDANAPLGSGLLLLGGMAVLYARRKKSN